VNEAFTGKHRAFILTNEARVRTQEPRMRILPAFVVMNDGWQTIPLALVVVKEGSMTMFCSLISMNGAQTRMLRPFMGMRS